MKKLFVILCMTFLIGLFSLNSFAGIGLGGPDFSVARNQSTGEVCIYMMASNIYLISTDTQNYPQKACYGVIDFNWEIISSFYDFDKNGNNDVLWRYKPSGAFLVWYMSGFSIIGADWVLEPLDQNWIIK